MGRPRPATLAMLSAVAVILPVTVFLATATAGTDSTIQQACGTDSAFLWNSDQDFGARDIQLDSEEPYGAQGVIYPSHAGDGGADNHRIQGGVYTLDGDRVRTYYDTYRVKTVTEARLVFRARKDSATDNISVKFGNHSLDGWVFGGYGISFHDGEVQSKVEYYHNDHGTEESDSLTRSLGDGVWYWFRIDIRSTGAGEKVLDAYVDYDGTDDTTQQWTPVMTGRTWTDGDWDPPSVPSGGQDSDEVADGVYLGPLNRVWIRGNGGGEVDYHRVTLCELGTSPGPTTTTTSPTLTSTTSTPPPSGPVKLPVVAVTASEHDGNVPANAIDGNLGTRWSAEGDPEWIRFQLGAASDVSSVKIAWYRGDTRRASFDVETSVDGSSWTRVFTGSSSGTTVAFETYDVVDSRSAYVRIVGHGNDANGWNSISEVELWGGSSPTTTPTTTTTSPPPSVPVKLPVVAVTASEHDGNVPANAIDGNLGTRWSAEGDPEWIRFQLGAASDVSSVKIAWYRGDTRRASFDVETSVDGSSWTRVFTGSSSGTTVAFETYDVVDSRSAYVRIVGHGNDANAWNSISEVELWGGSSPTTTPTTTTTPPPATGFSFAVIGDYGDGSAEAEDVADRVKSWGPELILTTGDNNYSGASSIDSDVGRFYHQYLRPYNGNYGPGSPDTNRFFPTLGNHDWDTNSGQTYLSYFTLPGNERYYEFTWSAGGAGVHFFAIDSDDREPDGNDAASTQAQWLQQRLAASTATWKIVYLHHSPFSSGDNHGSDAELQWPYRLWGADAVLSGHDHIYERIIRDGLPYFVNGAGGRSLYNCGSPVTGSQVCYDSDYGAMLVDVTSTSMRLRFITRAGTVQDDYLINALG